jgi:hypothetical protein
LVTLVISLVAAAACSPDTASDTAKAAPTGSVDADVLDDGGRVLGHLRASIVGTAGSGVFRPAHAADATGQVVTVDAAGSQLQVAGAHGLRLRASIDGDGDLSGTGQLDAQRVTMRGVAGEEHPHLAEGMKMLVVGRPTGEGYEALLQLYEPVPYDPEDHSRAALLEDRERFHGYAAIVFGEEVDPDAIGTHELLHAFYGTGKWVIVAPGTTASQAVLGDLHSYAPARPSAALAVRSTGPKGGVDNVRPVVSYPAPPVHLSSTGEDARPLLTAEQLAELAQDRADWFRQELVTMGRAHMSDANPDAPLTGFGRSLRRQGADGSVSFNLPVNAAAIQIAVSYKHQFSLTGSANAALYDALVDPCGYDQKTDTAWCRNSQHYQQAATPGGDVTAACRGFLAQGKQIVEGPLVRQWSGSPDPPPEEYHPDLSQTPDHKLKRPNGLTTFNQNPNGMKHGPSQCIEVKTQTGMIQGRDYYYAILEPGTGSHTLVVLTDPTINASNAVGGAPVLDQATNGTYVEVIDQTGPFNPADIVHVRELKETMLFLGAYEHKLGIDANPRLTDTMFEYSGSKSYPNQGITYQAESKGETKTQSISVGVFGDMSTGSYGTSVSESASVTIDVPSWSIVPNPRDREITYSWLTNEPLPWATVLGNNMAGFGSSGIELDVSASWELNPLNKQDFSPSTLTVWSGQQTYGALPISSTRTLFLVDHFSYFSPSKRGTKEAFWISSVSFDDNPNQTTPVTKDPVGPGINLCDPLVRAKDFAQACAGG